MRRMIIAAVVFAMIPVLLGLHMPNWYLADKQTAVEQEEHHRRRSRSLSVNRLSGVPGPASRVTSP
jgi:hypothetical protein